MTATMLLDCRAEKPLLIKDYLQRGHLVMLTVYRSLFINTVVLNFPAYPTLGVWVIYFVIDIALDIGGIACPYNPILSQTPILIF